MKISIYSLDGQKVYETWDEKLSPGSYSFTWDGMVNVMPPMPPPDGLAPPGLYTFDIEVVGASPYDRDWLRSRALWIVEHDVYQLPYGSNVQTSYKLPPTAPFRAEYLLRGDVPASAVQIVGYDPDFLRFFTIDGTTKTISWDAIPNPEDWNIVDFLTSLDKPKELYPYTFVFWAWDGWKYYKNHLPKTTFTNHKTVGPACAHFSALGILDPKISPHEKAAQECRCVYYTYNNKIYPHDFGKEWVAVRDVYPRIPQRGDFITRKTHLRWNLDAFLDALGYTHIVSFIGHSIRGGRFKPAGWWIGPRTGIGKVTTKDVSDRYSNWHKWFPSPGWVNRQGLPHMRVVVLMACFTGGLVSPDPTVNDYNNMKIAPTGGSFAAILRSLDVKIVIYSGTRGNTEAQGMFIERFFEYATKGIGGQVNRPGRLVGIVEAAKQARADLIQEEEGGKSPKGPIGSEQRKETFRYILIDYDSQAQNLTLYP